MRRNFGLILLICAIIGTGFLVKSSLRQTLEDVDIEELALYTDTATQAPPVHFPVLDTDVAPIPASDAPAAPTVQETKPTFQKDQLVAPSSETTSPPPLKKQSADQPPASLLTITGVVTATNGQRQAYGKSQLSINQKLSAAAAAKLADMFQKQYFDHVAPDGTEPSDWVSGVGYAYTFTGENLALGDFSGDSDLVSAWMNSPGHRENILKDEFTEIGVAVGKGMFDGRETWLAVQVFGRPLPSCTSPRDDLRADITAHELAIDEQYVRLSTKQAALQQEEPKFGAAYEQHVDEYNALVIEYNAIIATTKELVAEYNTSVEVYNTCIEQG